MESESFQLLENAVNSFKSEFYLTSKFIFTSLGLAVLNHYFLSSSSLLPVFHCGVSRGKWQLLCAQRVRLLHWLEDLMMNSWNFAEGQNFGAQQHH